MKFRLFLELVMEDCGSFQEASEAIREWFQVPGSVLCDFRRPHRDFEHSTFSVNFRHFGGVYACVSQKCEREGEIVYESRALL